MKDEETGLWPRGANGKEWTFQQNSKPVIDESETGDGIVGLYNMGCVKRFCLLPFLLGCSLTPFEPFLLEPQ